MTSRTPHRAAKKFAAMVGLNSYDTEDLIQEAWIACSGGEDYRTAWKACSNWYYQQYQKHSRVEYADLLHNECVTTDLQVPHETGLSENEKYIIDLICQGTRKTSELARLTGKSVQNINNARYRIRRKLKLYLDKQIEK